MGFRARPNQRNQAVGCKRRQNRSNGGAILICSTHIWRVSGNRRVQIAGADGAGAVFALLNLLEGDADGAAHQALADAQPGAARFLNVMVNGARGADAPRS